MIEYPDLHLTVSIGGVYGACPLDPGIRQADKLLYQAKECRNKCITAAFSAEEAENQSQIRNPINCKKEEGPL